MSRRPFFLFIFFPLMLLALRVQGAADPNLGMPSPTQDWLSLETPHFRIHFVQDQKNLAQRTAAIAEQVHAGLIKNIGWTPKELTEVVLLDTTDLINGFATPVPSNRTYLLLTPPVDGQLVSQNDWLELVFTHEYAHILHLDQVSGFPETMRSIFGRATGFIMPIFTFPQALAPAWVTEGYSTYHESAGGYGRGNNAIYDALMREEVIKGPASLTAESYEGYSGTRWPFGQIYLYGNYFFEFLQDRYGKQKAQEYVAKYSDNWVPWRMDNRAYESVGKSGKALWAEYQEWLKQRFTPQIEHITELGAMPGKVLVDEPYINSTITPGPDGSLYYLHNDVVSMPRIRQVLPTGEIRDIRELLGVAFLDWHPKQGLLVGKLEVCDNTDVYTDLYRLDETGKKLARLTHCQRLLRGRWSPAGDAVYAVQGGKSRTELVRVDLNGKNETLSQLPTGDVLGDLDLARDGSGLVASVKRLTTGWNLEWFDFGSREWRMLTVNGDIELAPRLSADGKRLTFISDHDGLMNIRRLDLVSGEAVTLSNTRGYAMEHAPDGAGGFWLAEYTGSGEVIRHVPEPKQFGKPYLAGEQRPVLVKTLPAEADFDPAQYDKTSPYSPWESVKPTGWTPVLSIGGDQADVVGLQIYGQDVLGFHRWAAIPLYYYQGDISSLGGLAYYHFYNRVTLSASRLIDLVQWDQEPRIYDQETHLQLLAHYPFNHLEWNLDLAVGTAWEEVERHWTDLNVQQSFEDQVSGLILTFDSRKKYLHSTGPAEGILASLTAESYDLLGNSRHEGAAAIAEGTGYLNLGSTNHNLSLDLLYGHGDDGIRPFELDGSTDLLSELGGITRLGRREFALRGYSANPELTGTSIARGTLDWRFPLARVQDGFFVPPLGLGKVWGDLFTETGAAWYSDGERRFHSSAGLELTGELMVGYDNLNLPITLGYAHGFDEQLGEDEIYLKIGFTF